MKMGIPVSLSAAYNRLLLVLLALAIVIVGCGGERKTTLTIEVVNAWGKQHYRLTCDPAGGEVPRPRDLCLLLGKNAEVMLRNGEDRSSCVGGMFTVHLRAEGVFDGRTIDATKIDACQGNLEAQRLWLSQLPPPPGWRE